MKYDRILFFTKQGNLHDYFHTDKVAYRMYNGQASETTLAKFEQERDIQLIAMIRSDEIPVSTNRGMGKRVVYYCKIKCPVNPLPVKGEFELPSLDALYKFLKANGWVLEQNLCSRLFE